MGIGEKLTKGITGGGVNIPHNSEMSNKAKNQMDFPGGMPGPGAYGKVVGKGMMRYMAGEPVGMARYKIDALGDNLAPKGNKLDLSKSSGKKSMSDAEKIKASKAKKEAAGNKKKAEGQADLKKAKEMKFISRGSGEDSGIATREERRKAIKDARSKKRAGRREARKARKKTVIKQKI